MTQVQAIARYVVPEENREKVLGLLRQLADQSRQEPGNVAFTVFENIDDPTWLVLLERYRSREALAAHRETNHFRTLVIGQIVPLLTERSVEELDTDEK
jgi:quinol monooxygenase YgiN